MDEVYQMVIGIVCGGNYTAIVQYFKANVSGASNAWDNAKALVDAFTAPIVGTSYANLIAAYMGQDCFISSCRARRMWPTPGAEAVVVYAPGDHPGIVAVEIESASVAAAEIWITDNADNVTGRNFYPGIPETSIDKGFWTAAHALLMADIVQLLVTDGIVSTEGTFKIVVRRRGVPVTYDNVLAGRLSASPATQRRRLVPF